MSKFFYNPTVEIDVSADFSMVAILAPNGDVFRKPFKIRHDVDGFNHFLKSNQLEVYVINPLITNSNKNKDIRKVKNDKKDAMSIAKIGKFEDIKAYSFLDINIFTIKSLCRDYYKLIDTRSTFKKKLSADLHVVFPGYSDVFSDISGLTSITILKIYQSPHSIINAPKEDVLKLLKDASHKGENWSNKTFDKLIKAANNAKIIAISSPRFSIKILSCIEIIESLNKQANALMNEITSAVYSSDTIEQFKHNINLLMSIPGLGFLTALTMLTEIGDFNGFLKPKQLVAYFGIDSSVNESGKFKSDKDKISKRGTRFGRRVLYA